MQKKRSGGIKLCALVECGLCCNIMLIKMRLCALFQMVSSNKYMAADSYNNSLRYDDRARTDLLCAQTYTHMRIQSLLQTTFTLGFNWEFSLWIRVWKLHTFYHFHYKNLLQNNFWNGNANISVRDVDDDVDVVLLIPHFFL